MSGPEDKFNAYVDTSTYNGATAVQNALSAAWTAYYTDYGVYPNVWVTVGSVVYLGTY